MSSDKPAKYLRFVRSIALGALVATGCGGEGDPVDASATADAGMDAGPIDAAIDARVDAPADATIDCCSVVDGPLHPPDLRRRA